MIRSLRRAPLFLLAVALACTASVEGFITPSSHSAASTATATQRTNPFSDSSKNNNNNNNNNASTATATQRTNPFSDSSKNNNNNNNNNNNEFAARVETIPPGGATTTSITTTTRRFAWPVSRDPRGMSPDYPLAATRVAITIACCYLTWFAQAQYSNVMASAALTLVCSMVFDKRLGQAAFCGTFAGMCSTSVIPTKGLALGLGAVTSVLYEILIHSRNAFLGVGGRLGFTAFLATTAVAYKKGVRTGLENLAFFGGSRVLRLSALDWEKTILPFAAWHAAGAVATIVLREVSDDSAAADPV
eukprot:CAMPEP_0172412356 /NCGR_PEP_ID=MMETSP1061-20121228/77861_1 /TAXON_ID=37318 /ORGANISM="Pseudo-nitzschia pungens, Strain cf. pungens" /LENGTH=302 /DNA_ID=CAMNT_0013148585 /DNA_START=121 /DNA_END=1026 /DNA_ORIENTATION=-